MSHTFLVTGSEKYSLWTYPLTPGVLVSADGDIRVPTVLTHAPATSVLWIDSELVAAFKSRMSVLAFE
ncbi:hypothetical protein [Paenibacillus xylanexedens]|uniref:hypothetical protein n=1 Tax=Paenibacillus xylanexedens TaxID=528191 RepID=UPI0011A35B11|nr:hypothetical protein [Paenibacillus xylanexedens]